MNKLFTLVTVMILSSSAWCAKESDLVTIFRTDKKETIWMNIVTDDNNDILKIKVVSKKRTQSATIPEIYEGATLFKQKGISVMKLKSSDLDAQQGGFVDLIYLKKFNFFSSNTYSTVTFRVLKDQSGVWKIFHNNSPVKQINITPYTWGIRELSFQK